MTRQHLCGPEKEEQISQRIPSHYQRCWTGNSEKHRRRRRFCCCRQPPSQCQILNLCCGHSRSWQRSNSIRNSRNIIHYYGSNYKLSRCTQTISSHIISCHSVLGIAHSIQFTFPNEEGLPVGWPSRNRATMALLRVKHISHLFFIIFSRPYCIKCSGR